MKLMWVPVGLLLAACCLAKGVEVPRDAKIEAEWQKARTAAKEARWDEAAAGLQALIEREDPVEAVVPVNDEAPEFSRGWREAAREALLSLPPEGRAACEKLVGAKATEALAAAKASGRREDLWGVERRWPATDAAWEARRLLAGEDAPPEEAIRALEVLLDHDPAADAKPARTALRIAGIASKLGDAGRVRFLAKRAAKEWKDPDAAKALDALAAKTRAVPRRDWPRFGGGRSGAGVFAEARQIGRYLWSRGVDEGAAQPNNTDVIIELGGVAGTRPASDPVVADGRFFVLAGDTLVAASLDRGTPLWSYRHAQEAAAPDIIIRPRGRFVPEEARVAQPRPAPPCVDGDLIAFASVTGQPAPTLQRRSEIHVLDAASGKKQWSWTPTSSPDANGSECLTSPILTPEGLFTLSLAEDSSRKRTAALIAFERSCAPGQEAKPKWKRLLATVPSLTDPPWASFQGDPDALLAYADGEVVVATNYGVVAGVDARSGDLRWTYAYASLPEGSRSPPGPAAERLAPPRPSWVILADGVVLFGAADTASVWAISPRTGKRLWFTPIVAGEAPVGYGAGRLYLAGGGMKAIDLVTGKLKWYEEKDAARAAVAENVCLCWGGSTLTVRRTEDGEEVGHYTWTADATDLKTPAPDGAILPLGDRLLLQARGRIYCFRLQGPPGTPEELEKKIGEWIAQLASPRFAERQAASEALLAAGAAAREKLKAAAESADREVSWRAAEVLATMQKSGYFTWTPKKAK